MITGKIETLNDEICISADNITLTTCESCKYRDEIERINDCKHGYLGCDIEESSDDILICEYIYLLKHIEQIRENYELCLLRNKEEYEKYNKGTTFTEFLTKLATLEDDEWLLETEMYSGLVNELIERGYLAYIDILWNRYIRE